MLKIDNYVLNDLVTLALFSLMSPCPICETLRYQPHVLAGAAARRPSGRRAGGRAKPYGAYPWYSTWMVDQGPFRLREEDTWVELEGPLAVVLPPFEGGRIDLPVSTLYSWMEWGAVAMRRIHRHDGGPAMRYPEGKAQSPSRAIWGRELPVRISGSLLQATRTMILRVNTLWWRSPAHRLLADAELARWLAGLLLVGEPEPAGGSVDGMDQEIQVLQDALNQGIGVGDWAALLGMHPRMLARRCGDIAGVTPHQLLNRVRLQRAEEQLLRPAIPIPHIAKSCGFGNRESFSVWFARQTGVPPAQWRRTHQRGWISGLREG